MMLSIVVARLLTAEDFGRFLLLVNAAGFLAIVGRFGTDQTALRYVAKLVDPRGRRVALGYGFRLSAYGLLFSVVFSVCVVFPLFWFSRYAIAEHYGMLGVPVLLGIVLGCLYAVQSVAVETFRGISDYRAAVIADRGVGGLFALAILGACYALKVELDLEAILTVLGLTTLVVLINALRTVWSVAIAPVPQNDGMPFGMTQLLRYSLPIAGLQSTIYLVTQADLWIVSAFLPVDQVGYYGAASRLALTISLSLTIVNSIIPPVLARYQSTEGNAFLRSLLGGTAFVAALPSLGLFLVFVFSGRFLLDTIFGEGFSIAFEPLVYLSLGQLISVFCGSAGYLLLMHGHRHILLFSSILSGFVGVVTALTLVRHYGMNGVAIGVGLGVVVHQLLMLAIAWSRCGILTFADPREVLAATRVLRRSLSGN